jgi:hypothetical protein
VGRKRMKRRRWAGEEICDDGEDITIKRSRYSS